MNAYITAAESVTPHNAADLIEALAALLDSTNHSQSAASIGSHACPNHLSLASMLLADLLLGSHSWACPSCSLPKRNSTHCLQFFLLSFSSVQFSLHPTTSLLSPAFFTPVLCFLLLFTGHSFLLAHHYLWRTVWLSSASALVTTPERIMYTGCFWWCHSRMDTCDESNGFWWTITALDTATNSLTQTQSSSSKPGLSPFRFGRTKTGWTSDTSSDTLLWKDTCGPKAHCSKY